MPRSFPAEATFEPAIRSSHLMPAEQTCCKSGFRFLPRELGGALPLESLQAIALREEGLLAILPPAGGPNFAEPSGRKKIGRALIEARQQVRAKTE
jgi:hypothetical protein